MNPKFAPTMLSLSAAMLTLAACASTSAASGDPKVPLSVSSADDPSSAYRLGPGDVIEISVWRDPELSRTIPVRPDGMISLPLANDVPAAGLTPMELRKRISEKLAVFAPAIEVSVIVREVHSVKVAVQGEVLHPGSYEMRGPTSVLEMLARAGGVTPFASHKILVLRQGEGPGQRLELDRQRLISGGGEDPILRSGDLVFVQ